MILRRTDHHPQFEDTEEATLEGDVGFRRGTARAALAHRDFRIVWSGSFASNIGTWMQNVALGAFAYKLTRSAGYVALLNFAQLGPLLALSVLGGALADAVDRKKLLIACQTEQLVLALVLSWVAAQPVPSRSGIVLCVLGIGIGNALNAPAFSAVLPMLVEREDLAGAVSLQSVQLNLSRVVGPAIGGLLLPLIHPSGVFAVNAVTYLFAILGLLLVSLPRPYPAIAEQGLRKLVAGFTIARRDPIVRRCLLSIATISFFCLPFVGLMPVIAARNYGIGVTSSAYGVFYACFGLGAALGAIAVGSVFAGTPKPLVMRVGLVAFAAALAAFALLRVEALAFPAAFVVGLTYFTTVTALSTILQEYLDDSVRGRVMALWIMGFGGTVPLGILLGGAIADAASITVVILGGAVMAGVLAVVTTRRRLTPATAGPGAVAA